MKIPDSVRTVLDGPGLAHLVTIEPDGRPQVSIVWVGLDGDEIVAGHLPEHRKIRNMRRDPRVALSVEAGTRNQLGLDEYLVVHGRARITEGGAAELLQRLPSLDEATLARAKADRAGGLDGEGDHRAPGLRRAALQSCYSG